MSLEFEHKPSPADRVAEESDPLEAIKRRQRLLAASSTEDFDLPGYEDLGVVVRYRRLQPDEWRAALDPLITGGTVMERCAQFLLEACQGVYQRTDTGDLEPLWPAGQEIKPAEAPGYGDLNQAWELGRETARDALIAVFGGDGNQIEAHADAVLDWTRSMQRPDDEATVKG